MVLWVVAVVAVLLACAAWARAGKTARKLEALNQSYWELRYEYTRLRSQVARLDPDQAAPDAEAAPPASPAVSFVPLSTMRKKDR